MRSDYKPSEPVLSIKPIGSNGVCMQGNKVTLGKEWSVNNNTPVVPATETVLGGLSKNASSAAVTRKIVPTDEGPISVATISEPLDRVVTSSDISTVIQLDSRRLRYQPNLEL